MCLRCVCVTDKCNTIIVGSTVELDLKYHGFFNAFLTDLIRSVALLWIHFPHP
ncbi:hypothetical protein M5D96_009153 [Drosophila gunungcola]|uniref:Uncharacterized protein n=1 Tax=Drosophila gunungcola TaxID=103775 RepID=A0A9P9YJK3_9MUSC|nr:hypothetical protein M5D96_009153 [Drosophila gunungcola]